MKRYYVHHLPFEHFNSSSDHDVVSAMKII
jgi:hypothetical protein